MKIGIIGSGSVGSRLGKLLTSAGHLVLIGSRSDKATTPVDAANHGEVVIFAIPYDATAETLPTLADILAGKIVVDATNPLKSDWSPLVLGPDTSAAEEIAKLLPQSTVVKAFNTIFADVMTTEIIMKQQDTTAKITAFVASDDKDAMDTVATLATGCGFGAVTINKLSAARYLEAMAHLNIELALGQGGGTNAFFSYIRGE